MSLITHIERGSRQTSSPIDAESLARSLRQHLRGEVRFDAGSRALYATDGSNYRQVPIGVVLPKDAEDVVATVALCREFGAPLLARGAGTSLAGQTCNVAVVLDFSKYMRGILEIDPKRRIARVQPGVILDDLRNAAERYHLTFGPDPATHNQCTLGGMIGNNSCGVHSVMAGRTEDNVEELDILTYDGCRMRVGATDEAALDRLVRGGGRQGEIYAGLRQLRDRHADAIRTRFPDIPRRVSGYSLPALLPEHGCHVARSLVGSEGTLVTVLEATVRLVPSPPHRTMLVLAYPDVFQAADHVLEVMAHGPIGVEGLDDLLVTFMRRKGLRNDEVELLPEGGGWLLVEFGGDSEVEAVDKARGLMQALERGQHAPAMRLFEDPGEQHKLWKVRESGLAGTAHVPLEHESWTGWEDSAVPPERMGEYLRELRELMRRNSYRASLYGHFGQGCVHTRIPFDLRTHDGIARFRSFIEDASDLVLKYGGSYSGEHGDGQSRAEILPKLYGFELMQAFRDTKTLWDPHWKMNPGKVLRPYRIDENLRLGTDYRPPKLKTHFHFPSDEDSFAQTTLRCVGVGKCRQLGEGTMCPSYMVTLEEQHSTRGRARLLFEMLEGWPLKDGWRDDHVREALDLCLSCKGCLGDCPVNVDMATYKAEFMSHYYAGRLRPRDAYSMGLIYWWSRLAARIPHVANWLTQTPGAGGVAKAVGGLSPHRRLPPFATEAFTDWFRRRPRRSGDCDVILWPDTFNNYFMPETAKAAVDVLEAAGCRIRIPERPLCCGRPLYDFGFLDLAKFQLRQILNSLRNDMAAGTPVVGLEPSCVAVFRNELVNLFPHDQDAVRLSRQTFTLAEFLTEKRPAFTPPLLHRKAVVHGHCHQKAIMGLIPEAQVMQRMELDAQILDSGCCGMSGSFGFKREHYVLSTQIGERVLLPAVRSANEDTLVIADGFSCREQIAQLTDRRALHLAQVLQMALHEGPGGPTGMEPERRYPALRQERRTPTVAETAVAGALFLAGAALIKGLRSSSTASRR